MTREEIRRTALRLLSDIAPEADLETLDPAADLRDQLDIDSMDFLKLVIGLHEALKVEIPEADYPKLTTLEGMTAYLSTKLSAT